ncbi:MAG: response regulator [Nocardioidaceae bacterium]
MTPATDSPDLTGIAVLLVDAHAESRNLLAQGLRSSGAVVFTAASAPTALRQLTIVRFDVVITDLALTAPDRYSFVRQIGDMPGATALPVIAITEHGFAQAQDILREGFAAPIAKPVDPLTLAQLVSQVVKRRWW